MKDIFPILGNLSIAFQKHDHPAVFTVEQGKDLKKKIPGAHTKNLFLCNKDKSAYYLVIVPGEKRVAINDLRQLLNETKLSFGSPEKLSEYLGLTPGSVSPFGLIHDHTHCIKVVLDSAFLKAEQINFHPNLNTATLTVSVQDFQKFLDWTTNAWTILPIPEVAG